MSLSKVSTLFSALSLATVTACGQAPQQPSAQEQIEIANANKAAADAQKAAADAQIAASQSVLPATPTTTLPMEPAKTPGENCVDGAKHALKITAIATGIGCFADLFVSGGLICAAALHAVVPTVVTAGAGGCAIGLVDSPKDAGSAGMPPIPSTDPNAGQYAPAP